MRDLLMAKAGLRGFLTDCRRDLSPEDVGIVPGNDPRRVPGLRRDEVARLLGVDTEYYADLERGQLPGLLPSWVEGALAKTLLLDDVDRGELARLLRDVYSVEGSASSDPAAPPTGPAAPDPTATGSVSPASSAPSASPASSASVVAAAPAPPSGSPEPVPARPTAAAGSTPTASAASRPTSTWLADGDPSPWYQVGGPAGPGGPVAAPADEARTAAAPHPAAQRAGQPDGVSPAHTALLDTFDMPAILRSRTLDVLGANRAGQLLYAPVLGWEERAGAHTNLLEFALLAGEEARQLWPDWDAVVEQAVAALRATAQAHPRDPDVIAVVGALSTASRTFGRLWAAPEGTGRAWTDAGNETFCHPLLGTVVLPYRVLTVDDAGSQVVVYTPEHGSAEYQALRRLVEWARAS